MSWDRRRDRSRRRQFDLVRRFWADPGMTLRAADLLLLAGAVFLIVAVLMWVSGVWT